MNIDIKEVFMADRITEREDYIIVNDTYLRALCMDMLPEQIHFGWFTAISYMPGVNISVTLVPYSHEEAANKIDRERVKLGAELNIASKNSNARRVDVLNYKYHFYRQLLADINLRRTNIVSASVVVLVTAPNLQELTDKCDRIQDIMGSTRITPMYLRQVEGLKTVLPNQYFIKESHDVTIGNAACLAPLIGVNVSHPSGIFFGYNESGSPCFIDLFIGQPRLFGPHMFITGMTRSGKSFTLKGIIARSIALGRKAVVIDPEGEYKKIAEFFQGDSEYIRFHPSMPAMFNPFDIEPEYDDEVGIFIDIPGKVDDITSLLVTMIQAQSGEKLSTEERSILSRAIRSEYEDRDINKSPDSIYVNHEVITPEGVNIGKSIKEMPTFSSLVKKLENMNATKLCNILQEYCKGGTFGFFDGQTGFNLRNKSLVIFDISALRNDNSKMYAMSVLLSWLWEKYVKSDKHVEKHLVVDEAWLMMLYPYTAQFMSQMARRGAKYNTSLIAASQSFREFTTEEGIVFLGQCNTKFFLKMEPDDAQNLGKIFNLSPELVSRVVSFVQGTGILRMGNESGIVSFAGFPFEKEFLDSNPKAVQLR